MSITINDLLTIDVNYKYLEQPSYTARAFNSSIKPYSPSLHPIIDHINEFGHRVMPINLVDIIQTEQSIIEPSNIIESIANSQLNFINSLVPEIVDKITVNAVYIALHSKLSEQLDEFIMELKMYQHVCSNRDSHESIKPLSPLEVGLINEYSLPYTLSTNLHHFTESLSLQSIIHFDSILTDEIKSLFNEIYGFETLLELVKSKIADSAASIISDVLPKRINYRAIRDNIAVKLAITDNKGLFTNNIIQVDEAHDRQINYFFYLDISNLIANYTLQKISIYNISAALSAISSTINTTTPDDIILTDCDRRIVNNNIGWVHLPIAELNDMRSPIDKLLSIDSASEFKTINIKLGITTVYSNAVAAYQSKQPDLLV